jgi:hypothetical protein
MSSKSFFNFFEPFISDLGALRQQEALTIQVNELHHRQNKIIMVITHESFILPEQTPNIENIIM